MYSNTQGLDFWSGNGFILLILSSSTTTISPFSTSLINFAPTISNAQVSEAKINEFFNFPIIRGLIPKGSLTPTSFLFVSNTNA